MAREPLDELGDVIIEFIAIGNSVKVSAVHVSTGEEVSIVGPATSPEFSLKRQAVAKLRYVLARKADPKGNGVVC